MRPDYYYYLEREGWVAQHTFECPKCQKHRLSIGNRIRDCETCSQRMKYLYTQYIKKSNEQEKSEIQEA